MEIDLEAVLLRNTLLQWLVFGGVGLGAWLLFCFLRNRLLSFLPLLKTRSEGIGFRQVMETILGAIRPWCLAVFSFSLASHPLEMSPNVEKWVGRITVFVLLFQLGVTADALINLAKKQKGSVFHRSPVTMGLLTLILRVVIWVLVVLLMLDNLGVHITALVAGLGVGGIAIALAVQNILGDLFASMTIALDQPFEVGDFIVVGDFQGTVERVGIKTTRIRSLSGEELVFSNSDLLQSRLRNFKRMRERRVEFRTGVTYGTEAVKIHRAIDMIRRAIEKQVGARFERCHFKGFGSHGLEIETVYWVLSPDFQIFMDLQQKINLEILEAFRAEDIYFVLQPMVSSETFKAAPPIQEKSDEKNAPV